jgi:NADPH:quinone reductase-like Zn-dependent oxidoreductase
MSRFRLYPTTAQEAVMREGSVACAVVLGELARLAAHGESEVPIARTYPLERVREAFRELEQGHTHGKIVLRP